LGAWQKRREGRRTRCRSLSIGTFRIVDWHELILPLLSKEESTSKSKESEMISSEARRKTLEEDREDGSVLGKEERRKRKRTRCSRDLQAQHEEERSGTE